MKKYFVVAGGMRIGNIFGIFGQKVPEGKFAVVSNGEYANGGYGPSQGPQRLFDTEEEAQLWADVGDANDGPNDEEWARLVEQEKQIVSYNRDEIG